jgi:hypothetical protein
VGRICSADRLPQERSGCPQVRSAAFLEREDDLGRSSKPAIFPLEQPIKFEFVFNLIAATALGLTVAD